MKSKTLILQSQTANKNGRAILTLSQQDDLLSTKWSLYNCASLSPQTRLGIYHKNQVYSSNMLYKDGAYTSSLVGDFDMNSDFYCAVIDTEHDNTALLAGGTYAGYFFDDTSVITKNLNNSFSKISPSTQTKEKKAEDCSQVCNASTNQDYNPCKSCKYKAYFYSQTAPTSQQTSPQTTTSTADDATPTPNTEKKNSIVENLLPQFDYIFKNFPECEELNTRIPNSRFAKISEGNSTYCIGAIYQEQQLQYICYAVPSSYNTPAPEELGKFHQWLPLDPDDPLSDGYHIVYQDAHDLKIIEV